MKSLLSWVQSKFRDEDAAVSVEFVLVFPVLALWMAGSFVWFDAFRAKSQMAKVGYAISDIASRYEESLTQAELVELFDLHKKLLPNRVSRDGWLRISSICWNGNDYRVLWSYLGDDTYLDAIADPLDDIDPRLLPLTDADLMGIKNTFPEMMDNDTIILTDVYAFWRPLVTWAGFGDTDLSVSLAARPRFSRVIKVDGGLTGYPDAEAEFCPESTP